MKHTKIFYICPCDFETPSKLEALEHINQCNEESHVVNLECDELFDPEDYWAYILSDIFPNHYY